MHTLGVIDDDTDSVMALTHLLIRAGYTVHSVASDAAVETLSATPSDLLLLDTDLKHISGFTLLQALREEPATALLPVILLSTHGRQAERLKAHALGANMCLVKPFTFATLNQAIQRLLAPVEEAHDDE